MDPTFAEVRPQPQSPTLSPSTRPPTRPIGHHRMHSAANSSALLGGPFVTISSPVHQHEQHSPSFSSRNGSNNATRPLSYASAHPARELPAEDDRPAFTLRARSPTPAQARAAAARARSKSPLPARDAQAIASAAPVAQPVRSVAQSPRVDGIASSSSGTKSSSSAASVAGASSSHHSAAVEPIPKSLKPSSASFPSASSASSAASSSSSSKSSAIRAAYQKPSEPVFLNVYDLHPYNQYLHGLGFGAYHSAVQIFGREYSFGFHSSSDTGVFSMAPMNVPNAVFREQIAAGEVYLTLNQFNLILNQMKQEWLGNRYHLLKKNCNHFSKALLAALGLKAPSFINRLAAAGDMLAAVVPSFMLPKQVNMLIQTGRPDLGSVEEDEKQEALLRNVPSGRSGQQGAGGVPSLGGGFRNISDTGSRASSAAGGEGNWRQIAPQMSPDLVPDITAAQADDMDDETFAEFLRASEREYAREVQLKQLRAETLEAAEKHEHQTQQAQQQQQPRRSPASDSSPSSAPSPPGKLSTARQDSEGGRSSHSARDEMHGYSRLDVPDRPSHHHLSPTASPGSGAAHARRLSSGPVSPAELDARIERAMHDFNLSGDVSKSELAQIRAVLRISMTAGAQ